MDKLCTNQLDPLMGYKCLVDKQHNFFLWYQKMYQKGSFLRAKANIVHKKQKQNKTKQKYAYVECRETSRVWHRRGVKQVKLSRAKQIGSLSPFLIQEITNLFFLLITYIILCKTMQPALNMTNLSHWILLFNLFNSKHTKFLQRTF